MSNQKMSSGLTHMKWFLVIGLLASGSMAQSSQAVESVSATPVANTTITEEQASDSPAAETDQAPQPVDIFDAIDQEIVDVKFIARSASKGRLVMTNKTKEPVSVLVPEAFAGVPVLRQFGGGGGGGGFGGGGGGFGGGGGGQQSVGGGGGGGGRGGGGGGRGAFNIAPERIGRLDVPLLCLDHGLRDPSSSKPYEIRPIEDVVTSPALVEIVKAYANGELPHGASQAAAWHINSKVSWAELASKLTGTVRSAVRNPYFSRAEMQAAVAIVQRAETLTTGQQLKPRNWKSQSQKEVERKAKADKEKATESYEHKKSKSHELKPVAEAEVTIEEKSAE